MLDIQLKEKTLRRAFPGYRLAGYFQESDRETYVQFRIKWEDDTRNSSTDQDNISYTIVMN